MREGDQSENEKRKKMNLKVLTVASHLAFVSGKAQHVQIQQKGRPPSVCEQKGPSVPVREKEGSAGKKKKRRTRAPRMRPPLVFAQEGAPVHL